MNSSRPLSSASSRMMRSARPSMSALQAISGVGLPRLHDSRQVVISGRFDDHMHAVVHHYVANEFIALEVKIAQRGDHQLPFFRREFRAVLDQPPNDKVHGIARTPTRKPR